MGNCNYWIDQNGIMWVTNTISSLPPWWDMFPNPAHDELIITDYDRELLRGMKIAPPEAT